LHTYIFTFKIQKHNNTHVLSLLQYMSHQTICFRWSLYVLYVFKIIIEFTTIDH